MWNCDSFEVLEPRLLELLFIAYMIISNLMNKVKEAREYIDKKALWLKSASPVSVTDLRKSARAVGAFFDSKQWTELLAHTQVRLTSRPYECALAGFVLFVMIIISRRLRVQI